MFTTGCALVLVPITMNINILKIGKLKSVGGVDRQSTQRGSTVNTEVINTVDSGGVNRQSMWRGSTVSFHFRMKKRLPLLILGGQLIVDTERINSQHR